MSQIRKLKSRFSSLRKGSGRKSKESEPSNLCNKLSVNEEYKAAFRTKSYLDMWSNVQGNLRKISFDKILASASSSSSSSSSSSTPPLSSFHIYMHLFEQVLEPGQDTLAGIIENRNLHQLLVEYFQTSLEACNICELILQSIHQARDNYQIIEKVIKLTRKVSDNSAGYNGDNTQSQNDIYKELNKFLLLQNPLSAISPLPFHDVHDKYRALLRKVTLKCKRVRKRAKHTRFCKKAAGLTLIASFSAVSIALLVTAFHSMVGILAAPVLVTPSLSFVKKRMMMARKGVNTRFLDRLGKQFDAAAKGLYILINDLDTMSRLVGRLHDEIEHTKAIANVCVRHGRGEVLKQIVTEFHIHEPYFMEQLEELEEHIYLCFLMINRSRRHVIQEITGDL